MRSSNEAQGHASIYRPDDLESTQSVIPDSKINLGTMGDDLGAELGNFGTWGLRHDSVWTYRFFGEAFLECEPHPLDAHRRLITSVESHEHRAIRQQQGSWMTESPAAHIHPILIKSALAPHT